MTMLPSTQNCWLCCHEALLSNLSETRQQDPNARDYLSGVCQLGTMCCNDLLQLEEEPLPEPAKVP